MAQSPQPKLNDAQEATNNRRARRTSNEKVAAAGEQPELRKPYKIEDAIANGNPLEIGNKTYYVTRFPLTKLKRAGLLMNYIPNTITICAGCYDPDTEEIDFERASSIFNIQTRRLEGTDTPPFDANAMAYQFGMIPTFLGMSDDDVAELSYRNLTEEEQEDLSIEGYLALEAENFQKRLQVPSRIINSMVELVYMNLSRSHPELTIEEVSDFLDLFEFVKWCAALFAISAGLKKSF